MIVRERANNFVMIEQVNHARISGELIANWKDSLFKRIEIGESVEYAIYNHDCAWKPIDKQPFWNDRTNKPYTFIDFPTPAKLVFYKHGIDQVEQRDTYSALLCSEHYKRFLLNDSTEHAKSFVSQENQRQKQLITKLPAFNKRLFDIHYELLQLCDKLSLYICLNEPGADKKDEHPFFRNGISVSSILNFPGPAVLIPKWIDKNTIIINSPPFKGPVTIALKQKVVAKAAIAKNGLIASYEQAPIEETEMNIVSDK